MVIGAWVAVAVPVDRATHVALAELNLAARAHADHLVPQAPAGTAPSAVSSTCAPC